MATVSQIIQDIINKNVFLQETINHGIVSYTKLAERIKPEIEIKIGKKVKLSAVIMGLRRYSGELDKKQEKTSFNYFREILLKTDICYIVVGESETARSKIQNLYNEIEFKQGGIFNIIQGNYEIGVITNQRYREKLLDLLSDEKILNMVEDLVVISLTYSKDFLFTPGVIYNIIRFIAWENINIISVILTTKELSIVISRNDTMRCYDTLERLVKPFKNSEQ
jgi:aspartokinase